MKRTVRPLCFLIVFPAFMLLALDPLASKPEPPNILVFLADDVGWNDFGCYGNTAIRTPNIDALADGGLLCTHAFLTSPQCSPTRISVLTGKYPHATGAEDLHMPLPENQKIVPSYLKKRGYFTGHMRKTHYGPDGEEQFDWYSEELQELPGFLGAVGESPFFLWVGFRDAHRPYEEGAVDPPHDPNKVKVPPYLLDDGETRKDLALYYDEISRMDEVIGSFVQELEERNLLENTLIVFFNDNGKPFPRSKGTLYDSGMRTALIFHWPKLINPGGVYPELISVIDLAPTFLDVAGADAPADMQGESVAPVFTNPDIPGREYVFAERNWHNCDEHMRCVRSKKYKLIRNAYTELPHGSPADVCRSPSWKSLKQSREEGLLSPGQAMLFQAPRPEFELYLMEEDPWEFKNLAEHPDHQSAREKLEQILESWGESTGDFPPSRRRRGDNTDRITGVKFTREIPPMTNP